MLKHTETYEIMTPESVGVGKSSLVMGKHSGRAAFKSKLKELGYNLGDNAMEDAFNRFKALADSKKHVYDEDIEALVDDGVAHMHDRIKVAALTVIAGTMGPQSATLTLDIDGQSKTVQSIGNGPVDATFNAIKLLVPHNARLDLYQVHAVTEGTDAQAEVSVRLRGGRPDRYGACRRPRYARRLRSGLCCGAQQARRETAKDGAGPAGDLGGSAQIGPTLIGATCRNRCMLPCACLSVYVPAVACNHSGTSLALDKAAILNNAAPSISWAA